jgi:hypothetical protein
MTVPRRFGILRFAGNLLKVLAWIVLLFSILIAVGGILLGDQLVNQSLATMTNAGAPLALPTIPAGSGIVLGVVMLLFGIIYFLALYVTGETMLLQLAVEENTRLTAALLLRMHQESQPESSSSRSGYGNYSGGFEN